MKYIAMLSGGQDSTAMTIRLLELGYPVDYIVFNDTTVEYQEMYEYIDKLDAFFKRKYGISITRLYPNRTFDDSIWRLRTKGDNIGKRCGTPSVIDMCTWRKESKQAPFDKWVTKNNLRGNFKQYCGFTMSESNRLLNAPNYVLAPLIDWVWFESDVQKYLKQNMMENKLYQFFTRTGCRICPKKSLSDWYNIYKYFNDVWEYCKTQEKLLNEDQLRVGIFPRWHLTLFTDDMEKLFKQKDRQQTFEFEFEEVQDCFCKI